MLQVLHDADSVWGGGVAVSVVSLLYQPHTGVDNVLQNYFTSHDISQVCDFNKDCDDGTDETQCADSTDDDDIKQTAEYCPDNDGFLCITFTSGGILDCLDWGHKCDGKMDCLDGSDEEMCQHWSDMIVVSRLEQFQVTNTSVGIRWWLRSVETEYEYKISYKISTHMVWSNATGDWVTHDKRVASISDLLPATNYDIRLLSRTRDTHQDSYHHPTIHVTTADGLPDPPRDITAAQSDDDLVISWSWPSTPNGNITQFIVMVFTSTGQRLRELEIPVRAEMNLVRPGMNVSVAGLEIGEEGALYQVDVVSVNTAGHSPGSDPGQRASITLLRAVKNFRLAARETDPVTATLMWDQVTGASNYIVCQQSQNILEEKVCHYKIDGVKNSVKLSGLSPKTRYLMTISAVTSHGSNSRNASLMLETLGEKLPKPEIESIGLEDGYPTKVKLSWKLNNNDKTKYQYGIYYGVNLQKLYQFKPELIQDTKAPVHTLDGCTKYIFSVAIVDSVHGFGPMSDPRQVVTGFSPSSPPRHVRALNDTALSWSAPCEPMPVNVNYHLKTKITNIYDEQFLNSEYTITLKNTSSSHMVHRFDNLTPGARYHVSVKTDTSIESSSVTLHGPPLPAPGQVFSHASRDSSGFIVSWSPARDASNYEVVLSPDNTFNDRSCNIVFPSISATSFNVTNEEFQHIPDTCSGHSEFNVGVRTVITDDRGHQFKSDFSRAGKYFHLNLSTSAYIHLIS